MTPNEVHEKFAHRKIRAVRRLMRPAFARCANVEELLEENLRTAIDGHGDRVRGRCATVTRIDMWLAEFVARVPIRRVVAAAINYRPECVVIVHEWERAIA